MYEEQKNRDDQWLSYRHAVCVWAHLWKHLSVCARMHAWETEKECNKAVHLGDLSGEATHCKTHLMYKWIYTLWVKNFKQTHTRAHTRSHTHIQYWITLIFVNSRRHSVMQICFWLSLSLRWRRCCWQAERLPKLSFYVLNFSFHELSLLLKSTHTHTSLLASLPWQLNNTRIWEHSSVYNANSNQIKSRLTLSALTIPW